MTGNFFVSIISILFALFFLIISLQLPPSSSDRTIGPAGWPNMILSLMILMGILLLIRTIREKKKPAIIDKDDLLAQSEKVEEEFAVEEVYKSKYLVIIGVLFIYLIAVSYLGFIITCPLLLISIALIIGIKRWLPIIISSFIGTACLTYVFPILLSITLPRGIGVFRDFSMLFY